MRFEYMRKTFVLLADHFQSNYCVFGTVNCARGEICARAEFNGTNQAKLVGPVTAQPSRSGSQTVAGGLLCKQLILANQSERAQLPAIR